MRNDVPNIEINDRVETAGTGARMMGGLLVLVAGDGADDWEMGVDAESAGGGGWGWCGRWETTGVDVETARMVLMGDGVPSR